MCGIAGVVGGSPDEGRRGVAAMCEQMFARGPDDGGIESYGNGATSVVLGAQRLAIIDLSAAGHQPMVDPERQTTIVFNGMIYNFQELRCRLVDEGERFAGHCDTEVILRAYGRYGSECVRELRGMFAFAIWDGRRNELFLARDRLGIKPLFYREEGGRFLFASQVRALLASGLVPARLSPEGIQSFLSFGAVSEPLTAVDGVLALPAAHTATLRNGSLSVERYWDFPTEAGDVPEEPTQRFRALLDDTVQRHLESDAPLGVFLSGGIDSSVLAGLAAQHATVRTVSVIFDERGFSEEHYIDAVVRKLKTEHVRVPLRPRQMLDWLDGAFAAMDQPTFDGINTYIVSRAASGTGLKVALSGLGGDELFDGYGHLRSILRLERMRRLPRPLALVAGRALLKGRQQEKAHAWLSSGFGGGDSYALLRRLFLPEEVATLWHGPDVGEAALAGPRLRLNGNAGKDLPELELTNYTKNVLMRDTDCMSMANSLEARVPFLDHALVEHVLKLPTALRSAPGKTFLVDATRDLLPPELFRRPKQGFLLPIAVWLREELRSEADRTLRRMPAAVASLLDQGAVDRLWAAFLGRSARWYNPWAIFALCRWAEEVGATA